MTEVAVHSILKVQHLADTLNMHVKEKAKSRVNSKVFGLSSWKDGTAIN